MIMLWVVIITGFVLVGVGIAINATQEVSVKSKPKGEDLGYEHKNQHKNECT